MAEIIPFRAILFNKDRVRGDDVIAPPYDIITPAMKDALYDKSPYNVVRIDFGKEVEGDNEAENKYTRAARYLDEWLGEDILIRNGRPAFYAYRMDYKVGGLQKSLKGFFGLVRVEDLGKGSVYPHEATYSKPKRDRLSLLRVSGANTSPIFALYNSPRGAASPLIEKAAAAGAPLIRAVDNEATVHSLWKIEDREAIDKIKADLSDKAVFIADGHHRYETALEHRNEARRSASGEGAGPCDYVLMFLANMAAEELTILPTHRLINVKFDRTLLNRFEECFEVETLGPDIDIIKAMRGLERAFGLFFPGGSYLLKYKGGRPGGIEPPLGDLDVVILQEVVFKELLGVSDYAYEMDYATAKKKVENGDFGAAFFLNPTRTWDVERVALSGLRMPPKSTYFYPKVPTGIVINSIKSF